MLSLLRQSTLRRVNVRPLATVATSVNRAAAPSPSLIPGEPAGPNVKTSIPGPTSKKIMERLNQYQDARSIFFVAGNT